MTAAAPQSDGHGQAPRSLPLILARELAANLATPMFLIDAEGTLVFYNEAAELMLGKQQSELGEIVANDFGDMLQLQDLDGNPVDNADSPAGIAFYKHEPAHRKLSVVTLDGRRTLVESTAYPLFGRTGEMHGVLTVFWESAE
jgi:PAS domain-containing protein